MIKMTKRQFTPEYKAKIVLEIIKEEKHISEIASREEISTKQLYSWKKEFTENASRVFSQTKIEKDAVQQMREKESKEQELMAKVGQLTIEVDWLKKKSAQVLGTDWEIKSGFKKCELLEVNRTSTYYEPVKPTQEEIEREELVKSRLDYWHTRMCYLGVRRLKIKLIQEDKLTVGRKLIKRYMDEMGIYAVYPKPNLSKKDKQHKIFPYLLRNISITKPNQVWAIDITYIKMGKSHMYLTAIIDWYSRFIVGFELSESLDTAPVLDAVKRAIATHGKPEIINSDQGSQFTSDDYVSLLNKNEIRQSMDGKARWVDNVIMERWFRSLKCDNIYISEYITPKALKYGIRDYVVEYNTERPHQSLGYMYPIQVFMTKKAA